MWLNRPPRFWIGLVLVLLAVAGLSNFTTDPGANPYREAGAQIGQSLFGLLLLGGGVYLMWTAGRRKP